MAIHFSPGRLRERGDLDGIFFAKPHRTHRVRVSSRQMQILQGDTRARVDLVWAGENGSEVSNTKGQTSGTLQREMKTTTWSPDWLIKLLKKRRFRCFVLASLHVTRGTTSHLGSANVCCEVCGRTPGNCGQKNPKFLPKLFGSY